MGTFGRLVFCAVRTQIVGKTKFFDSLNRLREQAVFFLSIPANAARAYNNDYGITCTDRIATVNRGRETVQIRPEKTFSKKLKKRVDETVILLYTKQVVSDETSKTTTT